MEKAFDLVTGQEGYHNFLFACDVTVHKFAELGLFLLASQSHQ